MKLYAISDLHLANPVNREGLLGMAERPDDWLIIAGDVGETEAHLNFALSVLTPRFAKLIWVPGNHDLWTITREGRRRQTGPEKYDMWVDICRAYGVLTPEDPFVLWPGSAGGANPDGPQHLLVPLFLGYDYSFRPANISEDQAVAWAEESGVVCTDEHLIDPSPHRSLPDWCRARLASTEARLEEATRLGVPTVLINHYPLRQDLVHLPRIPRFSIWCGTTATDDWHRRFGAKAVVYGHLHIKGTHFRDGVRFEEVSLGYPRDWNTTLGVGPYLRQILPDPRLSTQRPEDPWTS